MRVRAEQCRTCIFRPGSPLADRVGVLRDEWRTRDTHQICHASAIGERVPDGPSGLHHPETGEPVAEEDAEVCRGFYDRIYLREGTGQILRIMERLGLLESPPGE